MSTERAVTFIRGIIHSTNISISPKVFNFKPPCKQLGNLRTAKCHWPILGLGSQWSYDSKFRQSPMTIISIKPICPSPSQADGKCLFLIHLNDIIDRSLHFERRHLVSTGTSLFMWTLPSFRVPNAQGKTSKMEDKILLKYREFGNVVKKSMKRTETF